MADSSLDAPAVGNVKAVMLCNRPEVGGRAGQAGGSGPKQPPFVSAVISHDPVGLNSQHRLTWTDFPKRKTDSVTAKHKKWLRDLQKAKDQYLEEMIAQEQQQEEKARRMQEEAASARARIRQNQPPQQSDAPTATRRIVESANHILIEDPPSPEQGRGSVPHPPAQPPPPASYASPRAPRRAGKRGKNRPAWSMTAEKLEQQEEEELRELLEFTDTLDYDKYMEDLEVQEALSTVKARIATLEEQKRAQEAAEAAEQEALNDSNEDLDNSDLENSNDEDGDTFDINGQTRPLPTTSRARRPLSTSTSGLERSRQMGEAGGDTKGESESKQLADRLLQSSRSLRAVHSAHSLRAIVEKQRDAPPSRATAMIGTLVAESGADSPLATIRPAASENVWQVDSQGQGLPQPKVVTYVDNTRSERRKGPPDPNNLPYLYRNPAV